ncbi:hypothetical protein BKN38_06400 [Helicobacter sp. CLO-3]|uniref:hypothetical protein n=1 Tax=unclassified Helicobacter TaxID=2593540 RepID=UPI0008050DC3|nr:MULTISPECIES: hypothetical protein [unclassified Helicobacter]OBV29718.1 hypothetical protein BA723_04275 [Helicobacter sp. CLO-3]OHU82832.1 hypothetical protein BKN38_06400 [Helicobacter sp. CLO-3]
MKKSIKLLSCAVLAFALASSFTACAKKPKPQGSFQASECKTVCDKNECKTRCINIDGSYK